MKVSIVITGTIVSLLLIQVCNAQNILEILSSDENYNNLTNIINTIPDVAVRLTGPGPFTVFAPPDNAFAVFPIFNKILIDSISWGKHIENLLLFHALDGIVRSTDFTNNQILEMSNGELVTVSSTSNGSVVSLSSAGGAVTTIVVLDVIASNGIIHIIDTVLAPAYTFTTIPDVIRRDTELSTLLSLILQTDLTTLLAETDAITILAPTNTAFDNSGIMEKLTTDTDFASKVLLYHVIPAVINSNTVTTGTYTTINGASIDITVDELSEVQFDGVSNAIEADILAVNGIIHKIDKVLIPPAMNPTTAVPVQSPVEAPIEPTTIAPIEQPIEAPIEPTIAPVQQPVVAPSGLSPIPLQPITGPISVPSPDPSSPCLLGFICLCFSGRNHVHVQDKGMIPMNKLQIGDFVMVKNSQNENFDNNIDYSRVISFSHKDESSVAEFIQIYTMENNDKIISNTKQNYYQPLEISNDHMIQISNTKFIRAKDLQIGDVLYNGNVVVNISTIRSLGLYAPVTGTGTIIVSGVTASNYIAILDHIPTMIQHYGAHALYTLLRCWWRFNNNNTTTTKIQEVYTEDGLSNNYVMDVVKIVYRIGQYSWAVQIAVTLLVSPVIFLILTAERIFFLLDTKEVFTIICILIATIYFISFKSEKKVSNPYRI